MFKKISILIVLMMLALLVVPVNAATATNDKNVVHVTKIIVEPSGADLNLTMSYNTTSFTKMFTLIFGAKVIQPQLESTLTNFTNVSLVSIDPNNCVAKFTLKNQSSMTEGGWYVYNRNATFPEEIDQLEVRSAMREKPMVTKNTIEIPMFSYRV